MVPIKRQLDNSFNHVHDDKRQKIQITTDQRYCSSKETTTHLEHLSNELIYEIFEYFDYFHVYQTFPSLNQRFCDLVINSNIPIPIKTSLSSMSLPTFERYNQDIIQSNIHRISSLYCSDIFMYECIFSSIPKLTEFRRLETLILYNIESEYLDDVMNQLQPLPFLSSLVITSANSVRNINHIYRQIFSLRFLKYCKLSLTSPYLGSVLEICTHDYSSIEHLVITNSICCNQLRRLLSYVPKLRRVSIKSLTESRHDQKQMSTSFVNHLTHLSVVITSLRFEGLIRLIRDFFQPIQVLHITIEALDINQSYIDADQWQQLITNHLRNLRVFDIHIDWSTSNTNDQLRIECQIKQFASSFWIEKQWFFTYGAVTSNHFHFYSINPYRRKYYTLLSNQLDNTIDLQQNLTNFNSIQCVYLENGQSIINCTNYFPNATEFIVKNIVYTIGVSMDSLLSRIIPLKQLTKLTIECDHFVFLEVIKILRYAPNIYTLVLKTITLRQNEQNYRSIEQNEDFQLVSQSNNIRHVILDEICTMKKLKLLVTLCPRIHYLTLHTLTDDLEMMIRFLLDDNNPNTRYLYSLRFVDPYDRCFDEVNILMGCEELLDNCALIKSGRYFYLWW